MNPTPPPRNRALVPLLLLVPAPTVGVLGGFFGLGGEYGRSLWMLSKAWILLLPLFWWLFIENRRVSFSPLPRPASGAIRLGILTGIGFFAAILIGNSALAERLVDSDMVQAKAAETGLDDWRVFLGFATYTCLINSLLEEYIWRWFVTLQVVRLVPHRGWAIVISGLAFTCHHVFALAAQMPVAATVVASLGVFLGGITWSWLYLKTRSVWPGWISHLLADIAIMIAGWELIFR